MRLSLKTTYKERETLGALAAGAFDYENLAPSGRGGVVGSLIKKGMADWARDRSPTRDIYDPWKLVITDRGRRALRRLAPEGQREEYARTQGLRKLHGLDPIKRRRRVR
jgi:hypothetical protein